MKQIKQQFLLTVALLLSAISVSAYSFSVDGIYYNIVSSSSKTCSVTYKTSSYNSYSGMIVVPSKVTYNSAEYTVTGIGSSAFENCTSLTYIKIPETVTSIGDYAFRGCSGLTSVTIPNSVTSIGSSAFWDCSGLTSMTIPNSVTSIGNNAFSHCSGLTSIKVDMANKYYDSRNNCNAIINSTTNELVVGCKNTIISNSVTSIGSSAFSDCSGLTSVTIPNSVTSIGEWAFYHCSGLTSVTIPNSVTSIGGSAFYGCSGLTSVTLPNSVTSIGSDAFHGCSGLTSVTLPNSVTSIGYYAFSGCSGLTSVTIPNSVTSIGGSAFEGCSGLTSIKVDMANKYYDSRNNCNAIINSTTNELVVGCKNTIIPNSVTSIGNYAFYKCSGLTSMTIPNSVTSIGDHAFSGCSGLTSVTIPNSVTSIGSSAFLNCSVLTSVTIPNSVTSIGSSAFSGCSGLTSVTIGNSVTSIGSSAFNGCSGLTSISIPSSVTSIGSYAFSGCPSKKNIIALWETPPYINYDVFYYNYGTLHVRKGYASNYRSKNYWKSFTIIEDATVIAKSLTLDKETYYCKSGDIVNMRLSTDPSTIYTDMKWECSDPTIILLEGKSKQFLALSDGTVTITVSTENEDGTVVSTTAKVVVGDGKEPVAPVAPVDPTPEKKKCENPVITFANGKIVCSSATTEAVCHYQYNVTNSSGSGDNGADVALKIEISAYATAEGYEDSETVTKTFDIQQGATSGIEGDMNGDGVVNMQDANIIVNKYLGK